MTQLSNKVSTCEAQWKMLLLKVFALTCLTAVCAAQDDAAPVLQLKSSNQDVFTTEKIELSCNLADGSDWTFTWKRNGVQLQSSPDLSFSGDGSVLTIPAVTTTHSGTYTCSGRNSTGVVSKDSNSLEVRVTDPPTPTLTQVSTWSDVFISEPVEISCTVSSAEWTAVWYKDQTGLGKEGPSLNINSVTKADQGQYSCKALLKPRQVYSGFSNAVDVTVHDKPIPDVSRSPTFDIMYPKESITFTCAVRGNYDWEYVWYHNETEVQRSTSKTYNITSIVQSNSGKYYCKAKKGRSPFYTDASNSHALQISDPPTPTLTQVSTWSDVFISEPVEISCTVSSADWTAVWYKDQTDLGKEGPSLNINSVTKADQGQYSCKALLKPRQVYSGFSNAVNVTVHDKPIPDVSRSPTFDIMYPKESITFTCAVRGNYDWEYVWYHNETEVQRSTSNTYNITSIVQSNSGKYYCKAKKGRSPFYTDASNSHALQVSDPPTPTLTQVSTCSDVFISEPVEISCTVSSADWTAVWYKDQTDLGKEGPSLNINSVTKADQGQYSCKALLKPRQVYSGFSNAVNVTVHDKPIPDVSRSPTFDIMYPKESITFTCAVRGNYDWEYVWYHNETEVQRSTSKTYSITSIVQSNSGKYYCKAKKSRSPFYTDASNSHALQVSDPPTPTLTQVSTWSDVFISEPVEISCTVSSADWTAVWYKDQTDLGKEGPSLNINSVTKADQGQYSCKALLKPRQVYSGFSNAVNVTVHGPIPTLNLRVGPYFDPIYVGEVVSLDCSIDVSSGWTYQWYKGENTLPYVDKAISINLSLADAGEYFCNASRGQTTITGPSVRKQLNVKEIPVPSVKQITSWLDVFPDEKVSLSCDMQGIPDWMFTWYKDSNKITADGNILIENNGAKLSIKSALISHRGDYRCSGNLQGRSVSSDLGSKVQLDVYDAKPKVTLTQNPESNLMHTDDLISFTCHINVSSGWTYRWYKDDQFLTSTSENLHNMSSVAIKDSGKYKCQVKRGDFESTKSKTVDLTVEERPQANIVLLTGWSEVFSTDSLSLKCEVENSEYNWNYTWFKGEEELLNQPLSEIYWVTPQNDPAQSLYTCRGIRNERPLYSRMSVNFRTKNLLVKRRILLSISGCLFFGIILILLGCIALKFFRKPAAADEKPDEINLFPTMAQLKDRTDAPCPLTEYFTEADLNAPPKDGEENGLILSETTPLTTPSQEEQAVTTDGHEPAENGGGMVSFQH